MGVAIVAICAFVVMLVCLYLALNKDYHSGVFGTLFLACIGVGALTRLDAIFEVTGFTVHVVQLHASPSSILVWAGAAGWFGRAYVCFTRRLPGGNGWYACMLPQKQQHDTDEAVVTQ
jgi:hypothetical protein